MRRTPRTALVALVAATVLTGLVVPAQAGPRPDRTFDLQAHRGGLGLRVENTLASFGNALQLGVSTLELDVQITADGQAVVTHDRKVSAAKCVDTAPVRPGDPQYPYVGRYVNTLTLAQVRTLDCGARTLPDKPGQLAVPGARMPLLREVFDLVKRYRADDVMLNVETKVEAGAPSETAPREQFVQVTAREVRAAGLLRQVTIQSFDWGALIRMRQVERRLPLVALTNYDFLQVGQPGASPWLGGLDIDDFGGDPIRAVRSFGAAAFSPVHGFPQNGTVSDPGYRPYVTRDLVAHAHRNGLKVIPWTVDDLPTMAKLIDDGVDGLITDYPDRLRGLLAARGFRLPRAYASPFDVQAHRGGRATRPENTLPAFAHALENPAISTLELDTGVTADGQLVVLHDRTVNGSHCVDTAPARPGDPRYPYVGKLVHELTLAQLRTIDCGSKTLPEFPEQVAVPGARIPTLDEVFALVRASGRGDVRLNIETKISPLVADTEPYPSFTRKLVEAIGRAGFARRATIQSFDWRTIRYAHRLDPRIATVALVWQYGPAECATLADECSLRAAYTDPTVQSPWTGGLDWWRYQDLGRLVRASGATTVSANWQVHDPAQGTVASADWYLRESPTYFHGPTVPTLQRRDGLTVVPYTVNDAAVLQRVIDLGVDGVISDDPELLVRVAVRNGLR
ncbi:glycerophosphodiester phosphodiesterase family protein [Micromonospora sp. NPDC092111]|uniref:glycerophosphodiester phosphodiesterase family protein n=1 Tax=Micromonospora sp. NPDC092111 TaxID=3364289 RepID=UPI0038015DF1